MAYSKSWTAAVAVASAILMQSQQAGATEAVAGRYVPGAFAGPGAGIVPPTPGFFFDISNVYYHGEASADVPFGGGSVAIGMEGDIWVTALAGLWVPELDLPGNWTYAVQGAVPVSWTGVSAGVGPFDTNDEVTGVGDIAFAPVVLGWHNDAMNTFISTSLTITAPTGVWEEGELAFIGLNYWTFSPAIGFTHLVPDQGLDFSAKLGVDINTRNPDTNYYSGAIAHLDLSVTKNLTEKFAIGALAGILYQFEDDDSTFADAHNGFRGRSIAIGPYVSYKAKFSEEHEVNLSLKWLHEVEVQNRMKGDAIFFDISGKF